MKYSYKFQEGDNKHRFYSLMLNGKVRRTYPWSMYSRDTAKDKAEDQVRKGIKKYGFPNVEYVDSDGFYVCVN